MQDVIQSKKGRLANQKKRHNKIILYFLVLILILLLCAFVWLLKTPKLSIKDISISGIETLDSNSLISKTREVISGKYLFFFPMDNIIIYPSGKIKDEILKFDPRIKTVKASVDRKRILNVDIVEYKPAFAWCHLEECYYTDDTGYVFRAINYNPRDFYTVFRNGISKDTPIGSRWGDNDIGDVKDFLDFFKVVDIPISEVSFMGNTDYYFYTKNGTEFRIDFDSSIETAQSYLDIFFSQNISFVNAGLYEYVDARFGKKIYYKEKSGGGEKSDTQNDI